jgi:hypothetical protein
MKVKEERNSPSFIRKRFPFRESAYPKARSFKIGRNGRWWQEILCITNPENDTHRHLVYHW